MDYFSYCDREQMKKVIGQIEKQVEVIRAYYHTDDEIIYQESCLFKMKSDLLFEAPQIQNLIKDHNARLVTVNKDFFVIEKSGKTEEIETLYQTLKTYEISQFTRAGRIAVSKERMEISKLLSLFNA